MRFFNGTLCVDAGRGEKLEALLDVVGFEGESLFDPVLMHGDVADAVHEAEAPATQVHPEFIGPAVECLVDSVDIQNPQNVPAPQLGGIEADPVLQHGRCLRYHIVGGHQLNVVIY